MVKSTKTECSFCNQTRLCATTNGASICMHCVQSCKEITGQIRVGAIQCIKCHKDDKINIEMENNTKIEYKASSIDMNGVLTYSISNFTGEFKEGHKVKSATCGNCKSAIPLYLLDRSDYIL